LQVSLILAVMVTALAGVAANPLLQLANSSVARTPLLQRSVLIRNEEIAAERPQLQAPVADVALSKAAISAE
ncbi:MAG: hypothetical protein AAGJ80_10045, partial [Cyanobacteria bacterium J06553_1]